MSWRPFLSVHFKLLWIHHPEPPLVGIQAETKASSEKSETSSKQFNMNILQNLSQLSVLSSCNLKSFNSNHASTIFIALISTSAAYFQTNKIISHYYFTHCAYLNLLTFTNSAVYHFFLIASIYFSPKAYLLLVPLATVYWWQTHWEFFWKYIFFLCS